MTTRTANRSYYHYYAQYYRDGVPYDGKYYLTAFDLCEEFKCSRKTIMDKVRDPSRVGRNGRFRDIEIIRVKEPVYTRVLNPCIH